MNQYGIIIVSHVSNIAEGTMRLIKQVASNVPITIAGGINDDDVGTSIDKIQNAIDNNQANNLLAFYDLGSAKMTLEVCSEITTKNVYLYNVPIVEGAYSAASLLEVGVSLEDINNQLHEMEVK